MERLALTKTSRARSFLGPSLGTTV
uniref:Uncharacterized protein n=1 Tax=Anguilla anguilla TaxID=7936 RepID=A0A0E9PI59_ANGAN